MFSPSNIFPNIVFRIELRILEGNLILLMEKLRVKRLPHRKFRGIWVRHLSPWFIQSSFHNPGKTLFFQFPNLHPHSPGHVQLFFTFFFSQWLLQKLNGNRSYFEILTHQRWKKKFGKFFYPMKYTCSPRKAVLLSLLKSILFAIYKVKRIKIKASLLKGKTSTQKTLLLCWSGSPV